MRCTVHRSKFCVTWNSILCTDQNGVITDYVILFQQEQGGTLYPGEITDRTFTATGLTPFTSYTFRVAGVNEKGIGPFTEANSNGTDEDRMLYCTVTTRCS